MAIGFRTEALLHLVAFSLALLLCPAPSAAQADSATSTASQQTITVRGDDSYPPFSFIDLSGKPSGFDNEMMRAAAAAVGLKPEIRLGPWNEVRRDLEDGRIDALSGMAFTEERAKLALFSTPLVRTSGAVFVRRGSGIRSEAEARGRAIVVQAGDFLHDHALAAELTDKLTTVASQADALRMLATGNHDCALLGRLQGQYLVRQLKLDGIEAMGGPILSRDYCFAVNRNRPDLVAKLNEGLGKIGSSGEAERIHGKWFGRPGGGETVARQTAIIATAVIVPLGLLLAVVLVWSAVLRRRASASAADLNRESAGRRTAEEALQGNQARLQSLTSAMSELLALHEIVRDKSGSPVDYRILEVNPAWERSVGVPRARAIGSLATDVFASATAPYIDIYSRVASTGQPESFETHYAPLNKDFLVSVFSPAPGQFATVTTDITVHKQAELERRRVDEQIQQTQKLESLGVLAGGLAHDFNNLLTGILGNADLASHDLPPMSSARQSIEEIENAARAAADMCRQMLAYSGRGRFLVERVDLSALARDMMQLLNITVSKKAVLRSFLADNLPPIEADATQLRQIVMNLVMNAAEAVGDANGVVTVTTAAVDCTKGYLLDTYLREDLPEGRYVYCEVSDTGVGMSAETRRRIFEPFFTTKTRGRGLGLAAVLGIVRSHHGAIRIYSEPGKGTTVKVLFPAAPEGPGAAPLRTDSWDARTMTGSGTILLADDEAMVRSVGRRLLERAGFRVVLACDGMETVEIVRTRGAEIDCVLLDLTMPGLDGEETFRAIKAIRPGLPVILTSGYNHQDVTSRFAGRGLAGFVQKPYQMSNLVGEVLRALGQTPSQHG